MKRSGFRAALAVAALAGIASGPLHAQPNVVKNADDFSSVEYFDPPNQLQISSRISGAKAEPLADGTTVIHQFKLETFETNGVPKYIVEAPHCIYDQVKGTANSPGHLKVRRADGQVTLEGDGFMWRQEEQFLTMSNQSVTTIVKNGSETKIIP